MDEIIKLLEKLINECGDDIQAKTLNDISTLLSTVKVNKNSSYDAVQSTLYLIWDFFKKVFFTLYPTIKISSDAIQTVLKIGEVLDEANTENETIRKRIIEKTSASLKNNLVYNSNGIIQGASILPESVQESIDHKI